MLLGRFVDNFAGGLKLWRDTESERLMASENIRLVIWDLNETFRTGTDT